jgi:hypothetical protein
LTIKHSINKLKYAWVKKGCEKEKLKPAELPLTNLPKEKLISVNKLYVFNK